MLTSPTREQHHQPYSIPPNTNPVHPGAGLPWRFPTHPKFVPGMHLWPQIQKSSTLSPGAQGWSLVALEEQNPGNWHGLGSTLLGLHAASDTFLKRWTRLQFQVIYYRWALFSKGGYTLGERPERQ